MKTASRTQPRSSPPLVQMRRYTPGVYPFLFPSIISSLPQLPPQSQQRLQMQQPSSSGSTPSPVGEYSPLLHRYWLCMLCPKGTVMKPDKHANRQLCEQ
ncbi:hypothetical protein VZT92_015010 [Zoarces viviparus]|uniref:Uncharacterized protein n=1 Tax=Zoarces viviparus TaxID=48416 RepID=A0AAW1EVI1_ZOAVI